jgi:hypothetical protein
MHIFVLVIFSICVIGFAPTLPTNSGSVPNSDQERYVAVQMKMNHWLRMPSWVERMGYSWQHHHSYLDVM